MHNGKTFYIAKEAPEFMMIAELIAAMEETHNFSNLIVNVVSVITGELFARRNSIGLWEIYV